MEEEREREKSKLVFASQPEKQCRNIKLDLACFFIEFPYFKRKKLNRQSYYQKIVSWSSSLVPHFFHSFIAFELVCFLIIDLSIWYSTQYYDLMLEDWFFVTNKEIPLTVTLQSDLYLKFTCKKNSKEFNWTIKFHCRRRGLVSVKFILNCNWLAFQIRIR